MWAASVTIKKKKKKKQPACFISIEVIHWRKAFIIFTVHSSVCLYICIYLYMLVDIVAGCWRSKVSKHTRGCLPNDGIRFRTIYSKHLYRILLGLYIFIFIFKIIAGDQRNYYKRGLWTIQSRCVRGSLISLMISCEFLNGHFNGCHFTSLPFYYVTLYCY